MGPPLSRVWVHPKQGKLQVVCINIIVSSTLNLFLGCVKVSDELCLACVQSAPLVASGPAGKGLVSNYTRHTSYEEKGVWHTTYFASALTIFSLRWLL
jgi:hypothetical protein